MSLYVIDYPEADVKADAFDESFTPTTDYLHCVQGGSEAVGDNGLDRDKRREVKALAQAEMARLVAQYGVVIRPDDLKNWRPTQRCKGNLNESLENVTCIATDGLLGLFVYENGHPQAGRAFKAHFTNFKWHFAYVTDTGIMQFRQTEGKPPSMFTAGKSKTYWDDELHVERERRTSAPRGKASMSERKRILMDMI